MNAARRFPALPLLGTTVFAALLAGGTLGACGLTDGVDDLFAASGGVGGGTTGSSSSGTAQGGGSSSSSSSGTAQGGSSSSSSSSSGTAQGGSSSSSGTGGSMGSPEDCLDGLDNDQNGLVDCADPACTVGFECVAPTPGGWTGYFRVHEAPFPEAQPAPCPPHTQAGLPLYDGPAGDAQCSACTCGDVQGASCAVAPITCFPGSNSCGGNNAGDWTDALKDGNCHKPSNLLGFNNQLSCKLVGDSAVTSPGTCNPSGGAVQNPASWTKQVDICGAVQTGKGCGGGQLCIPRGTGEPGESLCVQKEGDKSCPDGWKATTIKAYTTANDSRSCSACTCGDASTTCGPTSYLFHDLNNCGDNDPAVAVDSGDCKDASALLDSFSWSADAELPQPTGTCAANGGKPQGNVQPEGPVTFCCK